MTVIGNVESATVEADPDRYRKMAPDEPERTGELVCRPAEVGDLEKIVAIESAVFSEPYQFLMLYQLWPMYKAGWTVAEVDGEFVGYALFLQSADTALLLTYAVADSFRKFGHGKRILQNAMRHRGTARRRLVYAPPRCKDPATARMLERLGFRGIDDRRNFLHSDSADYEEIRDGNLTCRRARYSDLARIADLEAAVFEDPYRFLMLYPLWFLHRRLWTVAEIDGRLVGYALLLEERGEALIFTFAVAERCRRLGYGEIVLRHAIARSRSAGTESITLTVKPANTTASRRFERVGFVKTGAEEDYFGPGEDRHLYSIDLTSNISAPPAARAAL
ncbi:GNAT family N-acetyltransferase [Nocardia jiangsuensis]|uniref:GNAT family N-acetyltransferase n=1 Tax=Nocardia jiangsuensis TaxID=1691563 RepID=A0ABV8DR42_9NOCA